MAGIVGMGGRAALWLATLRLSMASRGWISAEGAAAGAAEEAGAAAECDWGCCCSCARSDGGGEERMGPRMGEEERELADAP